MKGILYPAGNGKLKTDDNADIEIDGGVERIFARAHGYNKTDFQDGAGTILFRSRPANRRSAGRLRELKEVDFCLEDSVIAQVRYPKFLGPPEYWIGSSALAVTITVEEQAEVYTGEGIKWRVPFNSLRAKFEVSDRAALFPCIGFVYYCWAVRWASA